MSITRSNGKPSSALGIKLASGGNALETIAAVKNELKMSCFRHRDTFLKDFFE